ncbi:hypothetical protein CK203_063519 [Vitis vinifera]|uniref:Retrotransposon gag protein n=1 Tax=Vitis vinifera TaxID=29760 RepID=A0A438G637_VITVI|nr:hypothetical protein CK203_063519 [Vitis vinifera]
MNFMSYVAEVSTGWDEPNARNMGRMTSQPNAKGEMYILNDGIDMKAKIAAMARRLEELEMKKMQEVQAISQTPLQAMPCAICLSYEHLVEECPTIPVTREMFGDCNTYNSNWRNHPNFSWKPQPPQYTQPAQAPQQASNLEQAMVNLSKIDNLQYSILRFANLNTVQEKENSHSQPYQNSKGIHQVEAQKGESSMVKEVKTAITLRSGKEVDLPTCKLKHKIESETEKEKREQIKGNKKGKSIEKDDYDFNVEGEPQRIVIKEELMKKHMPPPFPQALFLDDQNQEECQKSRPSSSVKIFTAMKRPLGTRVSFRRPVHLFRSCEMAAKPPCLEDPPFHSRDAISKGVSQLGNHPLAHECHLVAP